MRRYYFKGFYVYIDYRQQGKIPFYVGKGSKERHMIPLRVANKHWMAVVKKEKGYTRQVVKSNLTEKQAFDLERKLIKKYKETVVNFTDGGEGASGYKHTANELIKMAQSMIGKNVGKKHTAETKRKMSDASKGNKYSLGYKHSDVTRLKMSIASKGKKKPMSMRLKLRGNQNARKYIKL